MLLNWFYLLTSVLLPDSRLQKLTLALDILANQQFASELLHSKNILQRQQQEQFFVAMFTRKSYHRVWWKAATCSLFRFSALTLSRALSLSGPHFFRSAYGHVAWHGERRERGCRTGNATWRGQRLSAPSGVAYEWLSMKYLCKQPLKSPERPKQTAHIIILGQSAGRSPAKGYAKS